MDSIELALCEAQHPKKVVFASEDDSGVDEELFVHAGSGSVLRRSLIGRTVRSSYRLSYDDGGPGCGSGSGTPLQAVRARFSTVEGEPRAGKGGEPRETVVAICILSTPELLVVYYPQGLRYDVPLPFQAQAVMPMRQGLLIQRMTRESGDSGQFPVLFSLLTHPLDEIKPVAVASEISSDPREAEVSVAGSAAVVVDGREDMSEDGDGHDARAAMAAEDDQEGGETPSWMTDPMEKVLHCCTFGPGPPLLLTYHQLLRRHALWRLDLAPQPPPPPLPTSLDVTSGDVIPTVFGDHDEGGSFPDASVLGASTLHPHRPMEESILSVGVGTPHGFPNGAGRSARPSPVDRETALASALGLGQPNAAHGSSSASVSVLGMMSRAPGAAAEGGTAAAAAAVSGAAALHASSVAAADASLTDPAGASSAIWPELVMGLAWSEPEGSADAASSRTFAVACGEDDAYGPGDDMSSSFLLCLLEKSRQRLRLLKVSRRYTAPKPASLQQSSDEEDSECWRVSVQEAVSLPCQSAVGIAASARAVLTAPGAAVAENVAALPREILLITPAGLLELHCGEKDGKIAVVNPPASARESRLTEVSDAVGDRCTLCFSQPDDASAERGNAGSTSGGGSNELGAILRQQQRAVRLRVSLAVSCPLTAAALQACEVVLRPVLALRLVVDVMRTARLLSRKATTTGSGDGFGASVGGSLEWHAFANVVLTALGAVLEARDGGASSKPAKKSAMEELLASSFHGSYPRKNAFLLAPFSTVLSKASSGATATPTRALALPKAADPRELRNSCTLLFDALHLLYEDLKIDRQAASGCVCLGSLLLKLARLCPRDGMADFEDHYFREMGFTLPDGGLLAARNPNVSLPPRLSRFAAVPCILSYIERRIETAQSPGIWTSTNIDYDGSGPFPLLRGGQAAAGAAGDRTRRLCELYDILCAAPQAAGGPKASAQSQADGEYSSSSSSSTLERLVLTMVYQERMSVSDLARMPAGLALPLLEALHAAAAVSAPLTWGPEAHEFVSRQDLAALQRMRELWQPLHRSGRHDAHNSEGVLDEGVGRAGNIARRGSRLWQQRLLKDLRVSAPRSSGGSDVNALAADGSANGLSPPSAAVLRRADTDPVGDVAVEVDADGLRSIEAHSALRFGDDLRMAEACRLMRCSRPTVVRVNREPEMTEQELQRRQQLRLSHLGRRTTATSVGRGALTIGATAPLLADALPIPPVALAGRILPDGAIVAYDHNVAGVPQESNVWPSFHNGAAAGLRLARPTSGRSVSRTWILFNRPSRQRSNAHGGMLMALGLQGHLSSLAMTDVYDYLTAGSDCTTVGLLLGMAAARAGSADLACSKMLCLHIPALLPAPFADMEVSSCAQMAAISGAGLLYRGTGHRLMTEFLLGEIGRARDPDRIADHDGYILSAGLALGFVNLGRGRWATQTSNAGGKGSGSSSGTASCSRVTGLAGLMDLNIEQRLHGYVLGGKEDRRTALHGGGWRADEISGPGTGIQSSGRGDGDNGAHANGNPNRGGITDASLGVSESRLCRSSMPDRVDINVTGPAAALALGLIYLKSNDKPLADRLALPASHYELDSVRPDVLMVRVISRGLILWDSVEPTTKWIEAQVPQVVQDEYQPLHLPLPAHLRGIVDRATVRQARSYVVAGACFAIGLRFAGTANHEACAAILEYLKDFQAMRDLPSSGVAVSAAAAKSNAALLARRPERQILDMCLSGVVVSLAMVMAGTGDVDCLRTIRELRWRVDGETRYGTHMAVSLALGLLFLSGGMATLGRSDEAVAALVAAFFPRWPERQADNYYHLQALRHMYALAVEYRGVEAVDVDTRESVYLPLEVDIKADGRMDPRTLELVAPCLLPEWDSILVIRVKTDRYHPITLDVGGDAALRAALQSLRRVFVKRRAGYMSYRRDPLALRSLRHRSLPGGSTGFSRLGKGGQSGSGSLAGLLQSRVDVVSTFTEDPHIQRFAQHLCDEAAGAGGPGVAGTLPGAPLLPGPAAWGDASALARFCGAALYDCLSADKSEALGLYLSIFYSQLTLLQTGAALDASSLRLVIVHCRDGALQPRLAGEAAMLAGCGGSQQAYALLRSDFVESLRVRLEILDTLGFQTPAAERQLSPLGEYYFGHGDFPTSLPDDRPLAGWTSGAAAARRLFGVFLAINGLPLAAVVRQAAQEGGCTAAPALADVPALWAHLPGVSAAAVLRIVQHTTQR